MLMKEWVAPLSTRASITILAPPPFKAQLTTGNYSSYRHLGLEIDEIRPIPTKGYVLSCADMVRFSGAIDLLRFCNS